MTVIRRSIWLLAASLFIVSLLLRLWGIGMFDTYRGDEFYHVPSSFQYIETGHNTPGNWYQPPLRNYIVRAGIDLFGDTPYGWRVPNAVLGSLMVLAVFMLARSTTGGISIPALAALLCALDPLLVFLSRSTFEEIPSACFFVFATLFVIMYLEGRWRSLVPAGIFFGLASAAKWYYFPAWVGLFVYVLVKRRETGPLGWPKTLNIIFNFTILPLCIYMLTYYPWFGRGYGIGEFFEVQAIAYRELVNNTSYAMMFTVEGAPWRWFAMPVIFIMDHASSGRISHTVAMMNNPLTWMLVIPSAVYASFRIIRNKERKLIPVLLVFVMSYVQFFFTHGRITLHSATASLPFAMILVGYSVVIFLDSISGRLGKLLIIMAFAITLVFGLYLYAFITYLPVPEWLYGPLMSAGNYTINK